MDGGARTVRPLRLFQANNRTLPRSRPRCRGQRINHFGGTSAALGDAGRGEAHPRASNSRDELKSVNNIPAAPIMVVADPHGIIRYAGGYTARKQGPDISDVAVITAVMQQHPAAPIPLFGCAVSATLSAMLAPLGIKELGYRL